mmetsp:Transcript_80395/g.208926  ORF Transcript_80395/g.208926 Transcript_80395/m.208926 type:complete len:191 (-) Transcript_80395:137-709(-)
MPGLAAAVAGASSGAAAEAAAALVRRAAKAGPDTPLEEVSLYLSEKDRAAAAAAAAAAAVALARGAGRHERRDAEGLGGAGRAPLESVESTVESWHAFALRDASGRRCVQFNLAAVTVHEVTPYSEIYGRHPREFVFDRHFDMIPAAGRFGFVAVGAMVGPEEEESDDDDDEPEIAADHKELEVSAGRVE